MSWFLFLDESGHDRKKAPYEVLAGVAIEDRELWNLIQRIRDAERLFFGTRISEGPLELKGKKLLKKKTFKLAAKYPQIQAEERRELALALIRNGADSSNEKLAALAQAKIAFVEHILELCAQHRVKVFGSILDCETEKAANANYLRKDYAFLFERFYYFLEDCGTSCMGNIVFDEQEKSQSHLLLNQMEEYFLKTGNGRTRASRILPEPFFVHSDLTTAIQLADIVAYVVSWGVRFKRMSRPKREELSPFVDKIMPLRHMTRREFGEDGEKTVWSLTFVDGLGPKVGH